MTSGGLSSRPVRLKVAYKSPEALLGEITRSVGRGGVRIESRRLLPTGTRFVFELHAKGVKDPVEVFGTVLSVTESAPARYVLHIRYEPPSNRKGLDSVIQRVFESQQGKRTNPRVPMHVRAVETRPDSPMYRLRDLSAGGVGVDVEAETLPEHISVGTPFLMAMKLTTGQLQVHGEVVWAVTSRANGLPPRVGVAFGTLPPRVAEMLNDLMTFKALPTPPWIARLSFGSEAVAGMRG